MKKIFRPNQSLGPYCEEISIIIQMNHRKAIIDLGTNTFQLLIVEQSGSNFKTLHEDQYAAKIGKGGISNGIITEEGIERAIIALQYFQPFFDKFEIRTENISATATSAVRNASNGAEFCERILAATGINVEVISGDEEAGLIYDGVKLGTEIGKRPSMIMDIGGGSVEFILCDEDRIFWKQSFEIGGQRLMDKFMFVDPISPKSLSSMQNFLEEQLLPLTNAVHQYAPEVLIGSAGSFETLVDLHYHKLKGGFPEKELVSFDLPLSEFQDSFQKIMSLDRAGRMALPGMIELRVDMIVVGVFLIQFVLKKYEIQDIKVSTYALKEGVLSRSLAR
ncbi:phosphatase [Pseudarcicella hirudinis]|nr:phosphatase [Pseudarcicella hirudinis]